MSSDRHDRANRHWTDDRKVADIGDELAATIHNVEVVIDEPANR
jgi:hypothetical protein